MSVAPLAEVEDGTRRAMPAALRRVAKALRAHVDDLTG
jgi:hypothetical protein